MANEDSMNDLSSTPPTSTTSSPTSSHRQLNMDHNKPKRQRRSYSCGPCKLLKIKCDLTIPCTSCQRFKRTDRCLQHPPQPPSQEELYKIKERKKRTNIKKLRLTNNLVQTYNSTNDSLPSMSNSITNVSRQIIANIESPIKYSSVDLNRYPIPYPTLDHQQQQAQQQQQPYHLRGLPVSSAQYAHQYVVPLPPIQPHTNGQPYPQPKYPQQSQSQSQSPFPLPQINQSTRLQHSILPPQQIPSQQQEHTLPPIKQEQSQPQDQTIILNPLSTTIIDQQLDQDKNTMISLSMVDIKRIKRLLPTKFEIFEDLHQLYLKSMNDQIMDIMNYETMKQQIKLIYFKVIQINDEDATKLSSSIEFNLIELRNLSLLFILLSNGYLFDQTNLNNFLLEKSLFKSKLDIINDWIKISKYLKLKIISYSKITDILYLLDWYFIIKNYYTYSNQIVQNYLEFNNLLNYAVLNNQFMEFIEDPDKDQSAGASNNINDAADSAASSSSNSLHLNNGNGNGNAVKNYPQSFEFKLLARYWMQLRLVEIEFTFFQYKGSLLSSNQLKNTIVPHKQLLKSLYGDNLSSIKNPLVKFAIQVWGLYYRRSKYSTSIKDIIKSYLELYGDIMGLYIDELKHEQALYFTTPPQRNPNEFFNDPELFNNQLNILMKNQIALTVFIRWLSFIRIETNYFPSLRYTSYLTSMMNLFNHFNLMDDMITERNNELSEGEEHLRMDDLLTILIKQFPYHYIRNFYQSLIYQSIFLIILQDFILIPNQTFKLNLKFIYDLIFSRFQKTFKKFLNSKSTLLKNLHKIEFFKNSLNLVIEFNNYLQKKQSESDMENSPTTASSSSTTATTSSSSSSASPHQTATLSVGDLTELIYQLKVNFISFENWEILINFYFGSRENFMRYIEKIWDLFEYFKIELNEDTSNGISNGNGTSNGSATHTGTSTPTSSNLIPITNELYLNDQLIIDNCHKLSGFEFDTNSVVEYIKAVVEPNIQE
ncbi:hypothetical protein DFJ63DRAFT_333878 [Scheffersomyces coipomensis]|uniref:uncharacterized protein n=1 Tax=Scheffersomyces coipomensis TaxID=1788519 RepID=UPI00315DF5E9